MSGHVEDPVPFDITILGDARMARLKFQTPAAASTTGAYWKESNKQILLPTDI
jgi:hypothetical protein